MSLKQVFTAAVLMTGAFQLATAQSLTTQCQTALANIVLNPEASCLNAQALVGLIASGSNSSIISPVNNWLTGLCAQPACTNDTLSSLVTDVTAGCPTELSALGFDSSSGPELITLVQQFYPAVRQIACTDDTANGNTLCVTETLTNLQPYTGTLTLTTIEALGQQLASGSVPNVPSNVTCSNCLKEAYNIAKGALGDLVSSDVVSTVQGQCGASFVDGAQPSGVTVSANTATATTTGGTSNGAMSLTISIAPLAGIAISSLVALSSAFAMLA